MNILFLQGDMSRQGGTERMTAWLSDKLCLSHRIFIFGLNSADSNTFYKLNSSVNYIIASHGNTVSKIFEIHSLIKKEKIDAVINVDTGMGYIGILSALGTKCKTVTWEHSNFFNNWNSKIFPHLRKFAASHSDAFVTLTEKDKSNYTSNIKCTPITVIPNPADRQDFTYNKDSKTILSVGYVSRIKRFDLIIPIAEKVFSKHSDWHWEICGDGPELDSLKNAAKNSSVSANIVFKGSVKDMDTQYKNAAMYVMTSEMEGLPMVLLEAKSHGLPIISFDINTGPSDIIRDGVNGFLITSGDIDVMANKICELIECEELRYTMSDNSQLDMEKYSAETVINKWEKLLSDLTK